MHKLICIVFLSASLLSLSAFTPASLQTQQVNVVADTEKAFKQKINELVEHWKVEISNQEDFSQFAHSTWEIQALGPGTHSFLVSFYVEHEDQSEAIGYLILNVTETGALKIGEYGKGPFDFLDAQTESPLHTIYNHPFEAVIIDEKNNVVDLFTNEAFPILIDTVNEPSKSITYISHEHNHIHQDARFDYAQHTPYFSPYDKLPWLSSKPINEALIEDRSIESEIELGQQLYYRVKSWNNTIGTVYAVTAIHKWNDNYLLIGLQLDNEQTIRYIPFTDLLQHGSFYSS